MCPGLHPLLTSQRGEALVTTTASPTFRPPLPRQRLEAHFNAGRRPTGHLRLDDSPLDALGGSRASSSVANEVRASALKETAMRAAGKDKMDRATVEQAIDPRTRMVGGWMGRETIALGGQEVGSNISSLWDARVIPP